MNSFVALLYERRQKFNPQLVIASMVSLYRTANAANAANARHIFPNRSNPCFKFKAVSSLIMPFVFDNNGIDAWNISFAIRNIDNAIENSPALIKASPARRRSRACCTVK